MKGLRSTITSGINQSCRNNASSRCCHHRKSGLAGRAVRELEILWKLYNAQVVISQISDKKTFHSDIILLLNAAPLLSSLWCDVPEAIDTDTIWLKQMDDTASAV